MHAWSVLVLAVHAVAASASASNSTSSPPDTSQVRLAYHGDTGMVVSWNTFKQLNKPSVHYGLSVGAMTSVATSDVSVTYKTSLTYNNHVWLENLLPDTTYYYQPRDLMANDTTESTYGHYSFKTAKAAGSQDPYTIAFVCDMGTMGSDGLSDIANKKTDANEVLKPGEQTTIGSLQSQIDTYDFVVHPGDIVYADYWLKEELAGYINATLEEGPVVYERILNEYYDQMEPITAYRPYMIGVGNHEADCDNGGTGDYDGSICMEGQTNFTGVQNHFRMPSDVSGGVGPFWYSFDYGMVHYVYFNTETDLGNGLLGDEQAPLNAGPFGSYPNEQADWLEADLKAVDRCVTPWVVALGHRPWFVSGPPCANCSTAFSQLFEDHNVDLVLQGHVHVYERNVPVYTNGTIDPNGYNNPSVPMYIINGIAGHWGGMDSFDTTLTDYHAFGLDDANATYGWSRLHFFNATHLRHEFVSSEDDSVVDSTILFKERSCAASPSGVATASSNGTAAATKTAAASGSVTAPVESAYTSTILSTTTYTITSCAATVTDCPVGKVTTDVITQYTTFCPESAAAGKATSVYAFKNSTAAATSTNGYATATGISASTASTVVGGSVGTASSKTSKTATTTGTSTTATSVVTAGAAQLGTSVGPLLLALAAALMW